MSAQQTRREGRQRSDPSLLGTSELCTARQGFGDGFLLPPWFRVLALGNTGEYIPQGGSVPSWVLPQSTEPEGILLDPLVKTLAALH